MPHCYYYFLLTLILPPPTPTSEPSPQKESCLGPLHSESYAALELTLKHIWSVVQNFTVCSTVELVQRQLLELLRSLESLGYKTPGF